MPPLVRSTVTSVAQHACFPQMTGFCSSSSTLFHLPPLESCADFQIVFPGFLSLNLNIIVLQPLSVSVFKSSYLWQKSMRRGLSFLGKICCTLGEVSFISCWDLGDNKTLINCAGLEDRKAFFSFLWGLHTQKCYKWYHSYITFLVSTYAIVVSNTNLLLKT